MFSVVKQDCVKLHVTIRSGKLTVANSYPRSQWQLQSRGLLSHSCQRCARSTSAHFEPQLPRHHVAGTWDHTEMHGCDASGVWHGGNVVATLSLKVPRRWSILTVLEFCAIPAKSWVNLHGNLTIASVARSTCSSGKYCRLNYGTK